MSMLDVLSSWPWHATTDMFVMLWIDMLSVLKFRQELIWINMCTRHSESCLFLTDSNFMSDSVFAPVFSTSFSALRDRAWLRQRARKPASGVSVGSFCRSETPLERAFSPYGGAPVRSRIDLGDFGRISPQEFRARIQPRGRNRWQGQQFHCIGCSLSPS